METPVLPSLFCSFLSPAPTVANLSELYEPMLSIYSPILPSTDGQTEARVELYPTQSHGEDAARLRPDPRSPDLQSTSLSSEIWISEAILIQRAILIYFFILKSMLAHYNKFNLNMHK